MASYNNLNIWNREENMSLLETIKNLIAKLDGNAPAKEQIATPEVKTQPAVETKPEVVVATKVKIKPETKKTVTPSGSAITSIQIPEDSALRRHFLSTLKANVMDSMPACPTDSSLKRHYDATVQAEVEDLLA